MKILLDVMSGDHAPSELIRGAILAAKEYEVSIVMIGNTAVIRECAEQNHWDLDLPNLSMVHADTVITMDDAPLSVVRDKQNSSMALGLHMLANEEGDAFVSAGNTGALHAGSSLIVRRIRGIQRSAIAALLPFDPPTLLLDAGANVEVTPQNLEQFAHMGSIYMEKLFELEKPRVGLLNNGSESHKGTKTEVEAYALLAQNSDIHFIGNLEGKDVFAGKCDVLVTDGFSGNILLKTIEGAGSFFLHNIRQVFSRNLLSRASALFLKNGLREMKHAFDASEYGGAPLLGLSKPIIKAHGNSDAYAVKNAVRQAIGYVNTGVTVEIAKYAMRLEQMEAEAKEIPKTVSTSACVQSEEQEDMNLFPTDENPAEKRKLFSKRKKETHADSVPQNNPSDKELEENR